MTARPPFTARPGTELPVLVLAEVTPEAVLQFARASGDTNPIHLDPAAARAAGMPDVIAHGMLTMAWLGRLVTSWAPSERLRSLRAAFVAPVPVGDSLTCGGTVAEVREASGEWHAYLRLFARRGDGMAAVRGRAVVAVDPYCSEGGTGGRG
ncbi:MaoC/PaaZ C-terminal domain-containing protein [Streptomyces sp. CNQ085]|uniref:MaoC/PaaZ C-terminal domain-containing protein n=1 Tax=Streptomyces sp. CNQ085 TaxID=2886944 RepID=UPI001F509447|nr:MaoC/PaaZ C-terminal domain-containing protein [Streptomyces sp. CNQ085]MCI0385835.1 MaoC family dehydratase N-terminal domain-containing protein [Streptomyces sp. CNQ085]